MIRAVLLAALGLATVPGSAAQGLDMRLRLVERSGPVLAIRPLVGTGGADRCAVLLEETRAPRRFALSLLCLGPAGPNLRPLEEVAASRAPSLGAGTDRAGRPVLLLGLPNGRVVARGLSLATARLAEPVAVLDDPALGRVGLDDRPDLDGDGTDDLVIATPQGLAALRRQDGRFVASGMKPLPRVAMFGRRGPTLHILGPKYDATAASRPRERWLRPITRPGSRIAATRVTFANEGEATSCKAWIRTVEPMRVAGYRVLQGAGGPLLFAVALPAQRVSVLGEWSLLLAPLECDPTARGAEVLGTARTPYAVWTRVSLGPRRDFSGDGIEDVVVYGTSGRLRPHAELLLFDGAELRAGRLPRPVGWTSSARRSGPLGVLYEIDLDDDGRLDLLFGVRGDAVAVVRGAPASAKGFPLEGRRAIELPLPDGIVADGALLPVRLSGGRQMALLEVESGEESGGRQMLALVWSAPAEPAVDSRDRRGE